ncbi:fibronectin type III domain-containing protein [Nakamurella flavida]|uniref:Fibronectin type III domain-containing protein n=1 Tax=Nakamurella flavida TaxID=363630 RepID=A0A938YLS1_9ACTN|nr:fibronectin type III domain-containing protein [Nakamurella flavida]MBM9476876.1 fibronectin type III domain-containing protein [Nakamurella flavida]MDP9779820.1 hypothetical protein [Nakamurella flavida]
MTTLSPTGAQAAPAVPAAGADTADGATRPVVPTDDATVRRAPVSLQYWAFGTSRAWAPTRLAATAVAGGQSTVSWAAPVRGARSVLAYVATRRATVDGVAQVRADFVTVRSASVRYTDLAPAVRYTVTVQPLSVTGFGPSAAIALASPAVAPGAPTGVTARPGDAAGTVAVAWQAPDRTGGAALTGYRIVATPAGGAAGAPVSVPASARTTVLTGLTAGTRYRLAVSAVSSAGTGSAAVVEYTVPVPAPVGPSVAALDTAAQRVVRVAHDGTVVPLGSSTLTRGDSIAVDAAGDVFAADRGGDTVLRYAAGTGTQSTVGSGWTDPQQIQTDAQGRVYVLDGTRVVRIAADGTSTTVLGTVDKARFLVVDAAGNASVLWDSSYRVWKITTLPAAGGAPVVRSLEPGYGIRSARIAADGTLYLEREASGGSGASWIVRVAPGSVEETQFSDRNAIYAYTVDPAGALVLLQSRNECLVPNTDAGCVSDRAVDDVLTVPAGADAGTTTPVSGLALPVGGLDAAADGLYVARTGGGPAGLVRYGIDGGAPTVIAAGAFADPEVLTAS